MILLLPRLLGLTGIYLAQPAADVLTLAASASLIGSIKKTAVQRMRGQSYKGLSGES